MDLQALEAVPGDLEQADFEVTDPNTGAYLFTLILAGPTHPATLEYETAQNRRLAFQSKRLGSFLKAINQRAEEALVDAEERVTRETENLTARTLGWRDVTDGGNPAPYDRNRMADLYRAKKWLRDAVSAFLAGVENFTGRSAMN